MAKGILFIAHSDSPDKRIMVGLKGDDVHTVILNLNEALRLAEHLVETVMQMQEEDNSDR